jgi:3-deoxy-D-manno-octulosonic-acid transferase
MRGSINANSRRTNLRPRPPVEDGKPGAFAYALYRGVTSAASPFLRTWLRRRAARGKEDAARLSERFGIGERPRPAGQLVWIHGASVGEVLAALPLIEKLLAAPTRHVLVTSGTVTSARLLAERLPARAFHQYVPLDTAKAAAHFLEHWKPDLALFVESELWPNLILEAHTRDVPLGLVNARFSERTYRGWSRARGLARRVLSSFDIVLAQDDAVAARLFDLGARNVETTGSIKADAPLLPVKESDLAAFQRAVGHRPILLAASTHPGEDEILCDAFAALRESKSDLLLVIAPRHPERGEAIGSLGKERGLRCARRSAGKLPARDTDLYIADTMGELGLFYRAAPFAFLGGSLVPHGGQNPLEPAKLGVAVLAGPHTSNFAAIFDTLLAAQGRGRVSDAATLAATALPLFRNPALARQWGQQAQRAAQQLEGALVSTVQAAETLLSRQEMAHAAS